MTDVVVLDTGVFLNILGGADEEGRVYQKIIRRCDRIAIQAELLSEYEKTLRQKFPGLVLYLITTRLSELSALGKLINAPVVGFRLPDIDEKDRHVISTAKSAHAKYVITTDRRHLWNKRDHIQASHHIEVLEPHDYLKLVP